MDREFFDAFAANLKRNGVNHQRMDIIFVPSDWGSYHIERDYDGRTNFGLEIHDGLRGIMPCGQVFDTSVVDSLAVEHLTVDGITGNWIAVDQRFSDGTLLKTCFLLSVDGEKPTREQVKEMRCVHSVIIKKGETAQ